MAVATRRTSAGERLDQWLARKLADPKWREKIKRRSHEANKALRDMGLLDK